MSVSYSDGRPHRPSRRPSGRREATFASQTQMNTVAQQPIPQQQAIPTPSPDFVSRYPIYHHRIIVNALLASPRICMTEHQQHRLLLEVAAVKIQKPGISLVQTKGVK